jgi:hypothetical protein
MPVMDPDLQLYVPPDFDDSGADAQVDISWKHLAHEREPMLLTLYFAFERPEPAPPAPTSETP